MSKIASVVAAPNALLSQKTAYVECMAIIIIIIIDGGSDFNRLQLWLDSCQPDLDEQQFA